MAWAEFIHFTARPVNGVIDPHVHTHCFVPNVCWDHVEHVESHRRRQRQGGCPALAGRCSSGDSADRLAELGYAVVWKGDSFEIAGISRDMIERFSGRTTTSTGSPRNAASPIPAPRIGSGR